VEQEAEGRSVDVTAAITRLAGGADDHADEEGDDHADEEHADGDPHVWLDPRNMAAMGSTAAEALTALGIDADAGSLSAEMDALHAELSAALATCTIEPMVVSHEAFGYLADAYGFTQVGISGLTPESEPSPRKLAEISDLVRSEGITTIYFEALASPAAAEAIAAETGVATALLDPIESSTDGKAYPVLMDENRAALAAGQGCS
jgi:zinc transport system substrate-binding protein